MWRPEKQTKFTIIATGNREYDPEGDSFCGNDETGEEWTC